MELINKRESFDKFIYENIKGSNLQICDLCCGHGDTLNLLRKRAKEIYGVDIDKKVIGFCKKRFQGLKKVKLNIASAMDTGFKTASFDYVILQMGLHHIKDKKKVMKEIHRILKKNGKFILIDKYYISPFRYYFYEIFRFLSKGDKHILNHHIRSEHYNKSLINKGFRLLKKNTLKNFLEILLKHLWN